MTAKWLAAITRIVPGALAVLGALAAVPARAAEQCAQLTDPAARLACYDAAYPVGRPAAGPRPAAPAVPGSPVPASPPPVVVDSAGSAPLPQHSVAEPSLAPAAVTAPDPVATPRAAPATIAEREPPVETRVAAPAASAPATAQERFGLPPPNPLAAVDDLDQLESTVVALRRQDKQNTIYRLANGQIWMQTVPRDVAIDEGDDVTIRRGLVGGYTLRNREGASTRVSRIR